MADEKDITPKILLEHMQAMEQRLMGEIVQLKKYTVTGFQTVHARIDLLTMGIDTIDKRLDDVEIELLPKRVRRLEKAVFH